MIQSTVTAPSTALPPEALADGELERPYRSMSRSGMLAFVVAIFSPAALLTPEFVLIPIIGLIAAVIAWINFRRFPHELVGQRFAAIGGWGCLALAVGSAGWHIYCYNTEVPPNYQRISFGLLKPDKRSKIPYSPDAELLDGQRVFIKGYVRPSDRKNNLKDFILVGDFGQCCFGGNPKINEVIEVSFQTEDRVNYSLRRRHIGGVFRLNKDTKRTSEKDVPRVLYSIEADYLK